MKTEERAKEGCAFAFDGNAYFENLCSKNRLAQAHGFEFCRVTGLQGMEEVLNKMRRASAFFAIDETSDGCIFRANGMCWKRRVYTVFLLKSYSTNTMGAYKQAVDICRRLFDQICARLLVDRDELLNQCIEINVDRILFKEMERCFLTGMAGVYFMLDVDEPVNLEYNADEWEQ